MGNRAGHGVVGNNLMTSVAIAQCCVEDEGLNIADLNEQTCDEWKTSLPNCKPESRPGLTPLPGHLFHKPQ